MARDKALWARIRADFLATGTSYPELAKKYGVSLSAVKRYASQEHWSIERDAMDAQLCAELEPNRTEPAEPNRTDEPTPTDGELMELKRDRLEKFMNITDGMMDRIQSAIESPDVITPYALKLLASALRDLREMQGLNRTQLDIEEQRARIAKIRSETAIPESRDDKAVSIEFVDTYGAET